MAHRQFVPDPDGPRPLFGSGPFTDRRSFLKTLGVGAAASVATGAVSLPGAANGVEACEVGPLDNIARRQAAFQTRKNAAKLAAERLLPSHPCNNEETNYPFIANFTKGLPHDALGEVDPLAYDKMLQALSSGDPADFEAIPLGGTRKLRNPQAGLAFDLEGPDSHHLQIRPAPRIDGPEHSSEMGEMYWHAILRDLAFTDYAGDATAAAAAADMSLFSDFKGPKVGGVVTPQTLFRTNSPGVPVGPYVSQFMLKDVPYGTQVIRQTQLNAVAGVDYMMTFPEWLSVQRGIAPVLTDQFEAVPRYMRTGRDLATYVHFDALYQAYLNACLILLGMGVPTNPGNPYSGYAKTDAFGTFGGPHILSLVTEVATRALKAVWYQKWYVHRRARPEVFGGRVDTHVRGVKSYPIDSEILNSGALAESLGRYGTALLPQAYPEGSPLHPSYGSGHTTVAGACVTILKAWFDTTGVFPDPVVPSADGLSLVPYAGADAGDITIEGELNKVACNVSFARNFAGIHWRTDSTASMKLGEKVAIGILEEQKASYAEPHSFTFRKFDGTMITI